MTEAHVAGFLADLLLILLSAKIFGEVAERLDQPAVLGELLGGVLLGFGLFSFFRPDDPALALMAQFGVVLLLFETGIHSDLSELVRVGPQSLAVAIVGVTLPFVLGWALMAALGHGGMQAVLVGSALTATSVGITARVLGDLGKLDLPEARIVLGAAVIDDILGIILLSTVEGASAAGVFSWLVVLRATALAVLFVAVALSLGPALSRGLVRQIPKLKV
ncbi:MAG: cation:proton antiporter, partial [Elusimicrobia bacterium]|nr:cation:proton antiporter [Elusimicrobiota bacterium]